MAENVSVVAVDEINTGDIPTDQNTNAAILNQLTQIQNTNAAMQNQLNAMSARMNATSARFYNSTLHTVPAKTVAFSPVVKYIPGHPVEAGLPPAVPEVQFQPEYNVDSPPPNGLMPLNYDALLRMRGNDLVGTRRMLRAIYWFYNEPSLALGAQANRATCDRVLNALDYFIMFP